MLAVRWVASVTVTELTVICGPKRTCVVPAVKCVFKPVIATLTVVLGAV